MQRLPQYSGANQRLRLVHGPLVGIFYIPKLVPFSSKDARGGVMVLLKLMEEEFMCGLLIGTL
jgi:hypothetical protein